MTVSILDKVLHEAKNHPLMVLAFARPEVHQLLPGLWARHAPKELSLAPLGKKACERLIHQVLGNQVPAPKVAQLWAQSEGNALFLEELIRAASEDHVGEIPQTVLAILQSRLGRLPVDARRALRTASIFGEVFWLGGVLALLNERGAPEILERSLAQLIAEEIITQNEQSHFPSEREYRFRHALIRDAAYNLLTEEDSRIGHLHAGQYLEQIGESDPMILIEHYRRAGALQRTGLLYFQAGNDAFRLCALPKARELYDESYMILSQVSDSAKIRRQKADVLIQQVHVSVNAESSDQNLSRLNQSRAFIEELMAGPDAEPADRIRLAQVNNLFGLIYHYRSQPIEALSYFRQVLPAAEESGDESLLALPSLLIGTVLMAQGQPKQALPLLARAFHLRDRLDNEYARLRTIGIYGITLVMSGRYQEGMKLHRLAIAQAQKLNQPAGLAVVYFHQCSSLRVCGDFPNLFHYAQAVIEQVAKSGDQIYLYTGLSLRSWAESYSGQHEAALASRANARAVAQELGGQVIASDWFAAADAEIALRAGQVEQAAYLAQRVAEQSRKEGQMLGLGLAEQTWGLALGILESFNAAAADAHLETAVKLMEECEQRLPGALACLEWAKLCHRRGDEEKAQSLRAQAVAQFKQSECLHLLEGLSLGLPPGNY